MTKDAGEEVLLQVNTASNQTKYWQMLKDLDRDQGQKNLYRDHPTVPIRFHISLVSYHAHITTFTLPNIILQVVSL